jgi:hypothetical protein
LGCLLKHPKSPGWHDVARLVVWCVSGALIVGPRRSICSIWCLLCSWVREVIVIPAWLSGPGVRGGGELPMRVLGWWG